MKLSEMRTRDAARCLCSIAPAIERIAKDPQLNESLRQMSKAARENADKETLLERMAGMIGAIIPAIFDRHYDDALIVLSRLCGKSEAEIDEQSMVQTMRDVRACMDQDLIDFFTSSGASA